MGETLKNIGLTCENATLSMDDEGVLHLVWAPGSAVSSADVDAVVTSVRRLTGAGLQPMLVELVDICMSPGAREVLLATRFVSAVAIVGATTVDRVMAAALLREQECPHGYFASFVEARDWLRKLPATHYVEALAISANGAPQR